GSPGECLLPAEQPAHETGTAILGQWRRLGWRRLRYGDGLVVGWRDAPAVAGVVQPATKAFDFALQPAIALHAFNLVADLGMEALQVGALTGHFRPFLGHADF